VAASAAPWGTLTFSDGTKVELTGERAVVGRYDHDLDGLQPDVDLSKFEGADTTSRIHAVIEHLGSGYTLTDLNSTNSTRLNGKRLEPEAVTPINDGDKLTFGKVVCTFNKA
jgi:pSer/pThr/pTyr-binding forkhead associated (FHA) protein